MHREPTVTGKKLDSNQRFGPEGRNKRQPEQNEEQEFKTNEERLRCLWENFKCSNIRIIGVPEGEEEEQEMKYLFEDIMKNFPNLAKERLPGSLGGLESPKEVGPKEAHTKADHNYFTQD